MTITAFVHSEMDFKKWDGIAKFATFKTKESNVPYLKVYENQGFLSK